MIDIFLCTILGKKQFYKWSSSYQCICIKFIFDEMVVNKHSQWFCIYLWDRFTHFQKNIFILFIFKPTSRRGLFFAHPFQINHNHCEKKTNLLNETTPPLRLIGLISTAIKVFVTLYLKQIPNYWNEFFIDLKSMYLTMSRI